MFTTIGARMKLLSAGGAVAVSLLLAFSPTAASAQPASSRKEKPTVILVHGAWADGSSWNGVIMRLLKSGYTVQAPPNPLRGLASDAATIATFVKSIAGPVILVGHSYGGAVISVAAPSNSPHLRHASQSME
jgi:pimeloyl-ACP methyl ester carboxylesterase